MTQPSAFQRQKTLLDEAISALESQSRLLTAHRNEVDRLQNELAALRASVGTIPPPFPTPGIVVVPTDEELGDWANRYVAEKLNPFPSIDVQDGGHYVDSEKMDKMVCPVARNVDGILMALGIKTSLGKKCLTKALHNCKLLDTKNQDYGSTNLEEFGSKGVLVRLNDKLGRMKTLTKDGRDPNHESLQDTWDDAANYGLIGAVMHEDEQNPNKSN